MPRLPRTFMDCPCYHIITRGNQRQIDLKKADMLDENRGHFQPRRLPKASYAVELGCLAFKAFSVLLFFSVVTSRALILALAYFIFKLFILLWGKDLFH